MDRLCERPGCSEPASVAYGMRPEDLVFWLDELRDDSRTDHGALCRRHADTMVVPRNWTLDDLRDPDLHLFRPPSVPTSGRRRTRRDSVRRSEAEQLALGVSPSEPDDPLVATEAGAPADVAETAEAPDAGADPDESATDDVTAPGNGTPWAPSFDAADDLDGLLAARSPLLARAFRGDDRPRRSSS